MSPALHWGFESLHEQMWQCVFHGVRKISPAVLVLQDIDPVVDDSNRSYFLNQLDGQA
ncbi:MAG: hypothetical protein VXZ82_24655 [Planctomycetota bacterium]|nr:hypothetical protein [Planctomycetota bacterium]